MAISSSRIAGSVVRSQSSCNDQTSALCSASRSSNAERVLDSAPREAIECPDKDHLVIAESCAIYQTAALPVELGAIAVPVSGPGASR